MPKVMITPPSAVQEKMAPTPKQNNQLISSLMNRLKGGRPASPTGKRKKQHQENRKRKNSKKNKGTPAASPWPVEQFLDEDEEEEEDEDCQGEMAGNKVTAKQWVWYGVELEDSQ